MQPEESRLAEKEILESRRFKATITNVRIREMIALGIHDFSDLQITASPGTNLIFLADILPPECAPVNFSGVCFHTMVNLTGVSVAAHNFQKARFPWGVEISLVGPSRTDFGYTDILTARDRATNFRGIHCSFMYFFVCTESHIETSEFLNTHFVEELYREFLRIHNSRNDRVTEFLNWFYTIARGLSSSEYVLRILANIQAINDAALTTALNTICYRKYVQPRLNRNQFFSKEEIDALKADTHASYKLDVIKAALSAKESEILESKFRLKDQELRARTRVTQDYEASTKALNDAKLRITPWSKTDFDIEKLRVAIRSRIERRMDELGFKAMQQTLSDEERSSVNKLRLLTNKLADHTLTPNDIAHLAHYSLTLLNDHTIFSDSAKTKGFDALFCFNHFDRLFPYCAEKVSILIPELFPTLRAGLFTQPNEQDVDVDFASPLVRQHTGTFS